MKQCFHSNVVTGVMVKHNKRVGVNMIQALTLSRNDEDVLTSNLEVNFEILFSWLILGATVIL
jgi:hypothetical protein